MAQKSSIGCLCGDFDRVREIFVNTRKCLIALSVAVLLFGSIKQSNAGATPVASAAVISTGAAVTGGFIAGVFVLVAYDLILKFEGKKNWDGTPLKP
jgi:hypothetical protein